MKYLHFFDQIESQELMPGFSGKIIHLGAMTITLWDIKAGSILPEHAHPNEQASMVFEGQLELTVGGVFHLCESGGIVTIPPNVPHSGKAITAVKVLDVFSPVRADLPGLRAF